MSVATPVGLVLAASTLSHTCVPLYIPRCHSHLGLLLVTSLRHFPQYPSLDDIHTPSPHIYPCIRNDCDDAGIPLLGYHSC